MPSPASYAANRRIHQRDGAQPADIAVVEVAAVVEREVDAWSTAHRRRALDRRSTISAPVKRGCTTIRSPPSQVDDDELGATPDANDGGVAP